MTLRFYISLIELSGILGPTLAEGIGVGIYFALLIFYAVVKFFHLFPTVNTVETLKKALVNKTIVIRNGKSVGNCELKVDESLIREIGC